MAFDPVAGAITCKDYCWQVTSTACQPDVTAVTLSYYAVLKGFFMLARPLR
jgi:hypothetical protein